MAENSQGLAEIAEVITELSNELIELYNRIQTTNVNAYVMSAKAAEITKIGINCFLTTKIKI